MPSLNDMITRNVVENLPVGLLIVDQTGKFLTVNPAATAILGYPREALVGHGLGEVFFEKTANHPLGQIFLDAIQKELVGLCREVPYEKPDGTQLWLSTIISYLAGEALQAGVVIILHDITELSRMQRRETEILTKINRVQEDKIRCLSRLASSVAHQIRNPAAVIGGFANRLERQLKAHGLSSEYPTIILEEAQRLERLVKTVGRFAALSQLNLVPTSLAAILKEACQNADQRALALSRTIHWQLEVPTVDLVADPSLLAMALVELFRNAVEFATDSELHITVSGGVIADHIQLAIADDGPGVAPLDAPHIFDPFYSSRPDGPGMGLPLAQEILIEHNGHIELDRSNRVGARFTLSLPLFPSHLMSHLETPDMAPAASS